MGGRKAGKVHLNMLRGRGSGGEKYVGIFVKENASFCRSYQKKCIGRTAMSILFRLDGVNGQLELYPDKLIIKRKGVLAKVTQGFFKGDKTIYLRQISSIQVKPGTAFTNGYIQFTLAGGNENTKGLFNATQDENTVMFAKKHNQLVEQIKAKIEELQNTATVAGTPVQASAAEEIKKFKELLDQGIITQEEFDKKKKQLLGI
jgi:hypothetical protein